MKSETYQTVSPWREMWSGLSFEMKLFVLLNVLALEVMFIVAAMP